MKDTSPSYLLVSHHLCPYVQRAAIVFAEKAIPFERKYVDLADKPGWFLAMSPLGKVPLLQVRSKDGVKAVIFESAVICEYLEETEREIGLHPADPLDRARHRSWIEFGSAILSQLWGLETARDAETFEAKRRTLKEMFVRLETALDDGPYFSGPRFSLVDAAYAPVFRYFDLFDAIADTGLFTDTPKVRAWRQALSERPSVKGAVDAGYGARLRQFLADHDAYLLKLGNVDI